MPLSRTKRTHIGGIWSLVAFLVAAVIITYAAGRLDRLLSEAFVYEARAQTYLDLLEVREQFEEIIHERSLALRELATFIGENPLPNRKSLHNGFKIYVKSTTRSSISLPRLTSS